MSDDQKESFIQQIYDVAEDSLQNAKIYLKIVKSQRKKANYDQFKSKTLNLESQIQKNLSFFDNVLEKFIQILFSKKLQQACLLENYSEAQRFISIINFLDQLFETIEEEIKFIKQNYEQQRQINKQDEKIQQLNEIIISEASIIKLKKNNYRIYNEILPYKLEQDRLSEKQQILNELKQEVNNKKQQLEKNKKEYLLKEEALELEYQFLQIDNHQAQKILDDQKIEEQHLRTQNQKHKPKLKVVKKKEKVQNLKNINSYQMSTRNTKRQSKQLEQVPKKSKKIKDKQSDMSNEKNRKKII